MSNSTAQKPDFSNFVSTRLIYGPAILGLLFLAASLAFWPLIIAAVIFLLTSAYFAYARYRFSPAGGNVQGRIQDLVLAHLEWDGSGTALDIGCGNAPLTIKLAQKYPTARITGIDYWGEKWAYSKSVCERNAEIAEVADRVDFQKASASALPFEEGHFNAAVSNLVFHEVADTRDKRQLIREALRVVKKGGRFVFQDLFLWKQIYGDPDELLATIKSWGVTRVEFVKTREAAFIPTALKLPFMVGTMAILYGEK